MRDTVRYLRDLSAAINRAVLLTQQAGVQWGNAAEAVDRLAEALAALETRVAAVERQPRRSKRHEARATARPSAQAAAMRQLPLGDSARRDVPAADGTRRRARVRNAA